MLPLRLTFLPALMLGMLVTLATPALAADPLARLMEVSGMNHSLDSFPAQITAAQSQSPAPAGEDPSTRAAIESVMQKGFDPALLKSDVSATLRDKLSDKDITAVLAWLESPTGRKITSLENAAAHRDPAIVQAELPDLMEDNKRFAKIRELDQAIQASASSINMIMAVQEAMLRGMMAAAPEGKGWNETQLQAYLSQVRPEVKARYELMTVASMMITYRQLKEEELQAYTDFANSPEGKRYHAAGMAALQLALGRAGTRVGEGLANVVRQQRAAGKP